MNIGIVGGGFTGLTVAHDLANKGHTVTVFEASSHFGGLASGFKKKTWDWTLERYYHHWFTSDSDLRNLAKELGLSEKLIFDRPKTAVYWKDQFHSFDTIPSLITFPGFKNPLSILRFGLVTALLKYILPWKPLERTTAVSWLTKYYGQELYQSIWQPLLEGKFGPFSDQVNMAWMWARLKARTPSLGTYRGGFQQFVNDFTSILKEQKVTLLSNAKVQSIKDSSKGITLTLDQKAHHFDQILVTTSPQLLSKLAPSLPSTYLRPLLNLKSLGAVVVIFSLKQPLTPNEFYWLNIPKNQDFPFLALVEHTNFVPSKFFNDENLIYCGDYITHDHEYMSLPPKALKEKFLPALKRINPKFNRSWVNQYWVYRTPYAQPVPGVNHSRRLPDIKTPIPGLFFASMAHIYPWDRGTNYAVRLGREVAKIMDTYEI
jgi:protoporphyrinogen oxidase